MYVLPIWKKYLTELNLNKYSVLGGGGSVGKMIAAEA